MAQYLLKRRTVEASQYHNRFRPNQMKRGPWVTWTRHDTLGEALEQRRPSGLYEWSVFFKGQIVHRF